MSFSRSRPTVQVVIDRATQEQILGLNQPFDLCDEAGRVFARATPMGLRADEDVEYPNVVVPFTNEEIEAARKEPGFSTDHLRQRLRASDARS